MSELIKILDDASDRYGNPHVLGFLERYHLSGFFEATEEQVKEYIQEEGLNNG